MPRIEIIERDETSAGVYSADTDVVYIPGLVDTNQECLFNKDGEYVGIEANVPTLFTNVKSFESLCGTRGVSFNEDQYYNDLFSETTNGFSSYATPYHRTMFKKGSIDPSYIMAKELLAAGLSVVYERINEDSDTYIDAKKSDINDENYTKYYKDVESYENIKSAYAPVWYEKVDKGELIENKTKRTDKIRVYELNKDIEFPYDVRIEAKNESGSAYTFTLTPSRGIEEHKIYDAEGNNVIGEKFFVEEGNKFSFTVKVELPDGTTNFDEPYKPFDINEYITLVRADGHTDKYDCLYTANYDEDELKDFSVGSKVPNDKIMECSVKYSDDVYMFVGPEFFKLDTDGNSESTNDGESTSEGEPVAQDESTDSTSNYSSICFEGSSKMKVVPENWNRDFVNYFEKCYKKEQLTSAPSTSDTNKYYTKESSISINNIYNKLQSVYSLDGKLTDKGSVSIKYLTSGGYPIFEYDNNSIASKMVALAEHRGDCVAIIDHTNNPARESNIDRTGNVYKVISDVGCQDLQSEFATMFTPWFEFNRVTVDRDDDDKVLESTEDNPLYGITSIELPGSYAYLVTLADSIKTNANWLAVAGSARGIVQNIAQNGAKCEITNGAADGMQPRDAVSINAITNIKPYGYTIWGNRTLKNNGIAGNLTATSFLNIRNLVSDVKKQAYTVSRQLTFEQNNDVLWANFKSLISSLLDRMLTGYGISGYKIERDTSHDKYAEKATLCARIILYPVYAVEDFYITVVLKDDEVSVE